mmetsp:Transcript_30707/g.89665  ORF Transcript_30707/g.89665 Transcript_30707/m.89665 type:complete len:223 (+) Transcript_30707:519-1187(+)
MALLLGHGIGQFLGLLLGQFLALLLGQGLDLILLVIVSFFDAHLALLGLGLLGMFIIFLVAPLFHLGIVGRLPLQVGPLVIHELPHQIPLLLIEGNTPVLLLLEVFAILLARHIIAIFLLLIVTVQPIRHNLIVQHDAAKHVDGSERCRTALDAEGEAGGSTDGHAEAGDGPGIAGPVVPQDHGGVGGIRSVVILVVGVGRLGCVARRIDGQDGLLHCCCLG